jgi:hypothetical protein
MLQNRFAALLRPLLQSTSSRIPPCPSVATPELWCTILVSHVSDIASSVQRRVRTTVHRLIGHSLRQQRDPAESRDAGEDGLYARQRGCRIKNVGYTRSERNKISEDSSMINGE